MEFVVGTVRTKPGRREQLLDAFLVHAAASRRDAGCLYFEVAPSLDDPDLLLLAECYESTAAHKAHQGLPHFAEFQASLPALAARIVLDTIVADSAEHLDVSLD